MLRRFFKKWLPHHDTVKKKSLRWLSSFLHDPNLWHLNRRSVSGGIAAGLLVAFIPLPIQMLLAVLLALAFRVNVLIAVMATCVTNPITFFPLTFLIVKVGGLIIGDKSPAVGSIQEFDFDWANISNLWHSFYSWFLSLGKAYLIGLPIVSIASAVVGYIIARIFWRVVVIIQYHRRKRILASKRH